MTPTETKAAATKPATRRGRTDRNRHRILTVHSRPARAGVANADVDAGAAAVVVDRRVVVADLTVEVDRTVAGHKAVVDLKAAAVARECDTPAAPLRPLPALRPGSECG